MPPLATTPGLRTTAETSSTVRSVVASSSNKPRTPKPVAIEADVASSFTVNVPCIIQGMDMKATIHELFNEIAILKAHIRDLEQQLNNTTTL